MPKLPESVKLTLSGAIERTDPPLVPHSMAFPSAMMSLQVLMGIPHHTHIIDAHGTLWRADHDYNMHLGVSGEGFKFLFDTAEYFRFNLPEGATPLRDCFEIAGIPVEIYSNSAADGLDGGWESDDALKLLVMRSLADGLPVLLLGRTESDRVLLAVGYEDSGDTLVAWMFVPGNDMTNKSFDTKDCQFIINWWQNTDAAAIVKDMPQISELRKDIILRAVKRGEIFLKDQKSAPYGKETNFYNNWIASFMDGASTNIYPEIWDLAERRSYIATFLAQAQDILETDKFWPGVDACNQIHDNMWRIHNLCTGENGELKIKDKLVRKQIVEIIEECRALDLKTAEALSSYLNINR